MMNEMIKMVLFRMRVGGIAAIIIIMVIIIIVIINAIKNYRLNNVINIFLTHPKWMESCINNPEWIKKNQKTYIKLKKKLNK